MICVRRRNFERKKSHDKKVETKLKHDRRHSAMASERRSAEILTRIAGIDGPGEPVGPEGVALPGLEEKTSSGEQGAVQGASSGRPRWLR